MFQKYTKNFLLSLYRYNALQNTDTEKAVHLWKNEVSYIFIRNGDFCRRK